MQQGRKGSSRSNRSGRRKDENERVSCSWLKPTLPPRTREEWGNLILRSNERMGQPPGNDLLSHTLSRAVQSALRCLTSVFGMETDGSPAVSVTT